VATLKKRRSLEEIYADMDRVNRQKPTPKDIQDLGDTIRKINLDVTIDQEEMPDPKVARKKSETELHGI
jgi:hypothetical protein